MSPQGVIDPVLEGGLDTDIVILAMGPTKAGRSTFLNRLVGSDIFQVSKKLVSCTENVKSHALAGAPKTCTELNQALSGRRIVLVDTPGFDATFIKDESEALRKISDWLEKSYRKGMTVGGILYLHDISRDDFSQPLKLDISLLSLLCGDDAMAKVAFITTKWDRLRDIKEGQDRVAMLKDECWVHGIRNGASVFHLNQDGSAACGEHEGPWDIVRSLLAKTGFNSTQRRPLQIQDEVVNRGRLLQDTSAGQVLRRFFDFCRKAARRLMGWTLEGTDKAEGQAKEDPDEPTRPLGPADNFHFQGTNSDVVLFVVGGIGVGKSTFISHVLDGVLHTGQTRPTIQMSLSACTLNIEPTRVRPRDSRSDLGRVVLVDGPGLDDGSDPKDPSRKEIMARFARWLRSCYPPDNLPQCGVIYIHDIAREVSGLSQIEDFLNLQAAIYLSTITHSGDILLITTKWGKRQSNTQDQEAEALLRKQTLIRIVLDSGYHMQRVERGRENETALSAVRYFLEDVDFQRVNRVAANHKKLLGNKLLRQVK